MSYDLRTPEGRYAASQALGPDGYNRAMEEHFRRETVETCNGYAIRRTVSQRFGVVYMVDGTTRGHRTLEGAREIANGLPYREPPYINLNEACSGCKDPMCPHC